MIHLIYLYPSVIFVLIYTIQFVNIITFRSNCYLNMISQAESQTNQNDIYQKTNRKVRILKNSPF